MMYYNNSHTAKQKAKHATRTVNLATGRNYLHFPIKSLLAKYLSP